MQRPAGRGDPSSKHSEWKARSASRVTRGRIAKGCERKVMLRQGMSWEQLQSSKGLRWELIQSRQGPAGERLYSLRISRSCRALAWRDGPWLRLLSLHPDHDSAY